jgi:hypothetical protein
MRARDTSEEAAAVQLDIYRRMEPSARLRVALELTELCRKLLQEGIHRRHPEYDAEQLRFAAIRVWLGPDLFRRAYPDAAEVDP